jgi:hypothetical protein
MKILHWVFDEILKDEGCPRLDQAAAFCNLADFDRCKAKAFRESRDGRTRILMVARDKYDSSTNIVGQWAGENLDRQLIEGLDQLRVRDTLRVDLGCKPSLVFGLLHLRRQHEAVRYVDDDLARPVRSHRADVLERHRSDRDEDDIGLHSFVERDRLDARTEFGGEFAEGFRAARIGDEDGYVLGGEEAGECRAYQPVPMMAYVILISLLREFSS